MIGSSQLIVIVWSMTPGISKPALCRSAIGRSARSFAICIVLIMIGQYWRAHRERLSGFWPNSMSVGRSLRLILMIKRAKSVIQFKIRGMALPMPGGCYARCGGVVLWLPSVAGDEGSDQRAQRGILTVISILDPAAGRTRNRHVRFLETGR